MRIVFIVERHMTIHTTYRFCILTKIDMVIMYSSVFCGNFTLVQNTATSTRHSFLREGISTPLPVSLNDI